MQKKHIVLALLLQLTLLINGVKAQKNNVITDIDGNRYKKVSIANQVWLQENLRTTTFNDGTPILKVESNTTWSNTAKPAYCWYNNTSDIKSTFGALYNWYVVEQGNVCPTGWHVATDKDWMQLELLIGVPEDVIEDIDWRGYVSHKLAGEIDLWVPGVLKNMEGFASTDFKALPAGNRIGESGSFGNKGSNAYWWCPELHTESDGAIYRSIFYGSAHMIKQVSPKNYGMAIRCVKD